VATFYLDQDGGNDANNGTTFALRWKTITNGATAGRLAVGDTIRIMASPDPTSLGNATWTGGGRPAALTSHRPPTPRLSSSPPHQRTVWWRATMCRLRVTTATPTPTASGRLAPCQLTHLKFFRSTAPTPRATARAAQLEASPKPTTSSSRRPRLVQNIALCGGLGQKFPWTASANVSITQAIAWKEGNSAPLFNIQTAFTTGKAAYYTLPATLDLSAYQQVSFWVRLEQGL
jgi:hypothetical protein